MGRREFLAEFKALHDKAKKGTLSPNERELYDGLKAQLGRLAVIAQQLAHSGETLRSNLRMAKMLKVEIRPDAGPPVRGSTIDLASGGFAMLMPNGMKAGQEAEFTLHLPSPGGGAMAPISGRVVVASSRPHAPLCRVSYRFKQLEPSAQSVLDFVLIDAILERFPSA